MGRVRSRKAAKHLLLATTCQSVRRVRDTELMLHTFWIAELHRNTNSPNQLHSNIIFLSRRCCKMSSTYATHIHENFTVLCDYRLLQRCRWDMRSFGDFARSRTDLLTIQDVTDRLSRNVSTDYMLRNIPK